MLVVDTPRIVIYQKRSFVNGKELINSQHIPFELCEQCTQDTSKEKTIESRMADVEVKERSSVNNETARNSNLTESLNEIICAWEKNILEDFDVEVVKFAKLYLEVVPNLKECSTKLLASSRRSVSSIATMSISQKISRLRHSACLNTVPKTYSYWSATGTGVLMVIKSEFQLQGSNRNAGSQTDHRSLSHMKVRNPLVHSMIINETFGVIRSNITLLIGLELQKKCKMVVHKMKHAVQARSLRCGIPLYRTFERTYIAWLQVAKLNRLSTYNELRKLHKNISYFTSKIQFKPSNYPNLGKWVTKPNPFFKTIKIGMTLLNSESSYQPEINLKFEENCH